MFGQQWDTAEATIIARDAKFTGDGSVATYTYVADVRLSTGETFRATLHEPTIATDFWSPNIRDTVSVLVRTKDRKVKFDKDDDRLSVKAYDAAKKNAFEETQSQPVGTQPAAQTSSTGLPADVASKLARLGFAADASTQVFTADSAQGQAALAAFAGAGAPAVQNPEDRLARLTAMHERGLLSDAEYAEQRHRILEEI